jgi:hypothetical protein
VTGYGRRCDVFKLDLDREERDLLVDLLETRLADLRMEIGNTHSLPYRDALRKKKKVLEKTVTHLRQGTDATQLLTDRK